jgi:membrane protein implicated in regulation of membrane protease activity
MGFTKLIFVAVVLIAGWFVYRKFIADAQRLVKKAEVKRKEQASGALGTLVKDPVTGEYRVRREEEE